MSQDSLLTYIERVESLRQQNSDELTPAQMREVAMELGLSADDLARADQQAQAHFQRAETLFDNGRLDEAVTEYEAARGLSPGRAEPLFGLARALYQRGMSTYRAADFERASACARQVLTIDPSHDPAAQLLNAIDARNKMARRSSGGGGFVAVALALVMVVGVAAGAFYFIAANDDAPSVAEPVASSVIEAEPPYEVALAPTLVGDSQQLSMQVEESTLSGHGEAFYRVRGWVRNDAPGTQVTELVAHVSLLDAAGTVLATKDVNVLRESDPALRTSDRAPLQILVSTVRDVVTANIEFTTVLRSPAPSGGYGDVEIPFAFRAATVGFNARAVQREFEYAPNQFAEHGGWAHVTVAITHTGTRAMTWMKVRVDFIDASGNVVGTVDRIPISSSGPSFSPGDTIQVKVSKEVPPGTTYRLSITEAR